MLAVVRNHEEPQARTAHKAQSYVSTHPKAPQHLEEMEFQRQPTDQWPLVPGRFVAPGHGP